MVQLGLIALCFVGGFLARKSGQFPSETARALNAFVVYVSFPCLVLIKIKELNLGPGLVMASLMPWIFFGMALGFILGVGKIFKWSRATTGCLILTAGFGNTSFVGFPMVEALYGRAALGPAIFVDQLGSFTSLSIAGIAVAQWYSGSRPRLQDMFLRIVSFPSFMALLIAVLLRPLRWPPELLTVLSRIGDTLVPLALFSVGFQLQVAGIKGRSQTLITGLFFKMLLGPALVLLLIKAMGGEMDINNQVIIFEAAMPPMITAGIIATEKNLDPDLASAMVGVGILGCFVTLPLWHTLLAAFAN